jgi:hypothetical protein
MVFTFFGGKSSKKGDIFVAESFSLRYFDLGGTLSNVALRLQLLQLLNSSLNTDPLLVPSGTSLHSIDKS